MTDRIVPPTGRPILAAAVLSAVILIAGCSGSEGSGDTTSTTAPAALATSVGDTSVTAPTVGADSPNVTTPASPAPAVVELAEPNAAGLLAEVLAAAGPGYHFVTTVTTGDAIALSAEGDRIGDATRLTVTSNDAAVEYVITADGAWAAQDGVWQELTQDAPPSDPIAALANPTELTVARFDQEGATLTGTYPASVLGLAGDQSILVTIDVVNGTLMALTYTAPGEAPSTSVRTVMSPLTATAPITTPDV